MSVPRSLLPERNLSTTSLGPFSFLCGHRRWRTRYQMVLHVYGTVSFLGYISSFIGGSERGPARPIWNCCGSFSCLSLPFVPIHSASLLLISPYPRTREESAAGRLLVRVTFARSPGNRE